MNSETRKTLKSALMASAAAAAFVSIAPAYAQDEQSVEKVVVTGSRIPQKGLTSTSPVSTISNTEAKLQGTTTAETLLNTMPQVVGNQGAEVSNGSTGTATLDLRGLGPKRTLVLVNGRRLPPANVTSPTPDVNTIALAMIDRVEVLTGGASAVYGADAVAGVVNFITRRNFEGVEFGGAYTINDHDNDNAVMRALLVDGGFTPPDKHVNDGRVATLWGIIGANTSDGKGNVTAYLQYRNAQALLQDQRDTTACSLFSVPDHICGGSSNGPNGRFTVDPSQGGGTRYAADPLVPGTMRPFVAALDTFNFAPQNYIQRPDDRYLLGANARYELAEDLELYAETSFFNDKTAAQIAASGFFANSGPINGSYFLNCSNPLLQTGAVEAGVNVTPFTAMCGGLGLTTTDTATVNIGRRFVENPAGRVDDFETSSYRVVGGVRGTIEDWDYDLYAQYATTSTPRAYLNDTSQAKSQRSILVVTDTRPGSPTFGQPVCQSVIDGTDLKCVPANIFSGGELSLDAINYITSTAFQKTETEEQVISGSMNGDFGFGMPWAADPIAAAFGAEYRFSRLKHVSDDIFLAGDLLGQGGAVPNVNGHYDVAEAFGEVQVPIVQDAPFAKLLEINAGYRISDYDNAGITHTYKYGGSWMPSDDIRVRASFQHAVRAPNVVELFAPARQGLYGGTDPCSQTSSGGPAFYNATQCANTGLTAAQYALFAASPAFQCPAAQCAGTFAGNPNLKPESSDTKSFGFVLTPTFLKGFNATVDWYDIQIDDVIRAFNPTVVLGNCAVTGNPLACSLIHRTPGTGSISNSTTLGTGVDQLVRNSGTQSATGIDVEVNYRLDFDDVGMDGSGALVVGIAGSYLDSFETNFGPGFDTFDCKAVFGLICGNPVPEWKHKARATWQTPWDVDLSLAWRHLGEAFLDVNQNNDPTFRLQCNGSCGLVFDNRIKSYDYLDVAFNWNVSDNVSLQGGINNLFDKDPPVFDSNIFGVSAPPFGNGNTFPVIYDTLGREVFVSVTTRL